jgi:hypothetical protein
VTALKLAQAALVALLLISLLWMFPPGCGPAHIGEERP